MLTATSQGFVPLLRIWPTHLVRKGMPFRDAHDVVGRAVQPAAGQNRPLEELSIEELNGPNSSVIEEDVHRTDLARLGLYPRPLGRHCP